LQFQVNGQDYLLDFLDEEGRWLLFKPTRNGIAVMPVIDDEAAVADGAEEVPVKKTVN